MSLIVGNNYEILNYLMLAALRLLLGLPWKSCIVFNQYTFLFFLAPRPLCLNLSVSWNSGVLKSIWKGTKPECFESTNQDTHAGILFLSTYVSVSVLYYVSLSLNHYFVYCIFKNELQYLIEWISFFSPLWNYLGSTCPFALP